MLQDDQFLRTRMLIGNSGLEKLEGAHVCVFGIGGVGGHVIEALARAGVGQLSIVDKDIVDITNLNRQIIATHETLDCAKVDVMRKRINTINPNCKVVPHKVFFRENTAHEFDFSEYDYVVDAIDTVSAKLCVIIEAKSANVPVITCMGMARKLDPTQIKVSDIKNTHSCGLARVMRKELRRRGISNVKCVFSTEPARECKYLENENDENAREENSTGENANGENTNGENTKPSLGSISFVPSCAGMIIASVVVRDLLGEQFIE